MKFVVLVLIVVVVPTVVVLFVRVVVVVVLQLGAGVLVVVDGVVAHQDDGLDDHVPDDQAVLDHGVDNHLADIHHSQDDTFDYTDMESIVHFDDRVVPMEDSQGA